MPESTKSEVALFPNQQIFLQSLTTGITEVHTGPIKVNPGQQDRLVYFDGKDFKETTNIAEAIKKHPFAPEGHYIRLLNPAYRVIKEGQGKEDTIELLWPPKGRKEPEQALDLGRKINIPGPITFPLWPGQTASVIRGHQPRSNQFLLVRVYNAEQAKKHWKEAQIKIASPALESSKVGKEILDAHKGEVGPSQTSAALQDFAPSALKDGDQFIIKGTEVSFYIPPTGIQVVQETDGPDTPESFIREALTLERMEYCILVGEDGNKRYEIGPQVVFPKPTEEFIARTVKDGIEVRKFNAAELTIVQGLYVMVTADYKENGKDYKAGEELFIKGSEHPIYFPRPEHRLLGYDKRGADKKHYATAIPAGQGKYALSRKNAEITIIRGPNMCLLDPREKGFVRRALTKAQSDLWYPGNAESAKYNEKLREMALKTPSTRQGAISEGEYGAAPVAMVGAGAASANFLSSMDTETTGYASNRSRSSTKRMAAAEMQMERSSSNGPDAMTGAEESTRSNNYSEGRYITIDPKYSGVPIISPYRDFAVEVKSLGTGKTQVVLGPDTILMEYDAELTVLRLSTSKPKTTDVLFPTVYLQHKSNKVSDIIEVDTADHVKVQLKYSLNVDFDNAHKEKWFSVQNYVKLLCDHVRSVLKATVKKTEISELYLKSTEIIRDTLLGKAPVKEGGNPSRPNHMLFTENGMRIMDVDVLDTRILDQDISKLMESSAVLTVKQNIELQNETKKLEAHQKKQEIERKISEENTKTILAKNELVIQTEKSSTAIDLVKKTNLKQIETEALEVVKLQENTATYRFNLVQQRSDKEAEQQLKWEKLQQELSLQLSAHEAKLVVDRLQEMNKGFTAMVGSMHDSATLEKVASAMAPMALLGGKTLLDTVKGLLPESLAKVFSEVADRGGFSQLPANNKTPQPPASKA